MEKLIVNRKPARQTGTTDKLVVERKNAATNRLDVRLVRIGKSGRSTTKSSGIINPSGAVIGSSEIATAVHLKKSAIKKAFGITPICCCANQGSGSVDANPC